MLSPILELLSLKTFHNHSGTVTALYPLRGIVQYSGSSLIIVEVSAVYYIELTEDGKCAKR